MPAERGGCRSLAGAEAEARDLIAAMEQRDAGSCTVDVVPDLGDLAEAVREAGAIVEELDAVQRRTAERSRAVVALLKQRGLSGNDTAKLLRVSPQRVSQLSR